VLTGGLLKGEELHAAMNRATVFVQAAVKATFGRKTEPRNGIAFEELLPALSAGHVFLEYEKL
jgi:hydroxymethylpyrimidine/phosphomethylpyrimidine kinase